MYRDLRRGFRVSHGILVLRGPHNKDCSIWGLCWGRCICGKDILRFFRRGLTGILHVPGVY